jgi:hypothetical protein
MAYQGRPIAGVQPFLDERAAPDSSGELRFLRNGAPQTLRLPSGQLGAGLLELAEHARLPADAETLFALLEAGYAGDRDRLMGLVRARAEAIEAIHPRLGLAAATGRPGAAQLREWVDALGTFLDLDRQGAQLEERLAVLEAERSATEQELVSNGSKTTQTLVSPKPRTSTTEEELRNTRKARKTLGRPPTFSCVSCFS